MKISETFYSVQGEGKLSGVPSFFIRTSGCNLRCVWCDTPYASWNPEGEERTVGALVKEVRATPARHVVLTGGEPMIQAEIGELFAALKALDYHVTIETAGTIFKDLRADLMSISPKLANSTPWEREGGRFAQVHEKNRVDVDALADLMRVAVDHQLKFVVERESDLAEIEDLLGKLPPTAPSNVLLMPEGVTVEAIRSRAMAVSELCKARGYRYCPRMHVELYGNKRGT